MAERRQVPRYMFDGVAQLSQASSGLFSTISLKSISVSGCRAGGEGVPTPGQKCDLRIDWEGKQFQAPVEVMWKNGKGEVGLKFLSVDDQNLKMLRNLCSGLMIEPLAQLPPEDEKKI